VGEYRTPPSVVKLLIALSGPHEGIVCDPACGHGEILSAVHEHSAGRTRLRLVGQDVSKTAGQVALFRLLAHGVPGHIALTDALIAHHEPESADMVLVDPPLGQQVGLRWVELALRMLTAAGRAFVITSDTLLSNRIDRTSRRELIASGRIHTVIALPPDLYNPHSSAAVALWCLGPARAGGGPVLLVDASMLGSRVNPRTELTADDVAAIASCVRQRQVVAEVPAGMRLGLVPVGKLVEGDSDLRPARWLDPVTVDPASDGERLAEAMTQWIAANEQFRATEVDLPAITAANPGPGSGKTIREMVDEGSLAVVRSRRIEREFRGTGNVPLIRPGDLRETWEVTPTSTVDPELLDHDPVRTKLGDVLVQIDGDLRVAVDRVGGAVVSAPVHVVRCLTDRIDPLVLAAMFTHSMWRYATRTASIWHVDLYRVQVPFLDRRTNDHLARTLRQLVELHHRAGAAMRAADELRAGLVAGFSSGAFRLVGEEGE
jgi:hypothetical protein